MYRLPPPDRLLRDDPPLPEPHRGWSWAGSLVAHALLIVILGLIVQAVPAGMRDEDIRTVELYVPPADAAGGGRPLTDASEPSAPSPPSARPATSDATAVRPAAIAPTLSIPAAGAQTALAELQAASGAGAGLLPGAGGLTTGVSRATGPHEDLGPGEAPKPSTARVNVGPPAKVSMFGTQTEGHMFVFVIDRSASMGRGMTHVLEAAKSQLTTAINRLGDNHQFQIVFYNDRPSVFRPGQNALVDDPNRPRTPVTAPFATAENKREAREFVQLITPTGATQHDLAMLAAMRLMPDAIYLLTDAHPPTLTPLDLKLIKNAHGGRTTIHTIEFGSGPAPEGDNFLKQLARENGGQHRYLDVMQPLKVGK